MKKYLLMLPLLFLWSFVYAEWLPELPMDIYGNTNVIDWFVEVYGSWEKLVVASIKNWIYGNTNAKQQHVLISPFDWELSFKIIYNWTTYDTKVQSECPMKFVSKVCRYDLDIVEPKVKKTETTTNAEWWVSINKDTFKPALRQVSKSNTEMEDAYGFAYRNKITTQTSYAKANMNWTLTRAAMAKMLSYYAINLLWQRPDTSRQIDFNDVSESLDKQYNYWISLAYQLWIMWINMERFRPYDLVTRAEFGTALSRMLFNTKDGSPYYKPHLDKLKAEWILTNTDPDMEEIRWYVMLMLMRSFKW